MAASTMPSFVGQTIHLGASSYKLEQVLGQGSFGVVFRVLDLSTSASTPISRALKVVRKSATGESNMDDLLRRETQLHHRVSGHPNVVTLHDAFEDKKYIYLVLDYCPGGSLVTQLNNGMFYKNDALVRKVFVQILDAVHACHEKGVFHRDLKPENILCNTDGSEVYLADFGLATDGQSSKRLGCGTATYMSPGKRHSRSATCVT